MPAESTLVIYGSVGNIVETPMTKTGINTYKYFSPPLGTGNTVFTADVKLSVEPAQLVALDKSIVSVKRKISTAHGFGKLVAEAELAFLELLKAVLGVFEHPSFQALETDKLILIVN